jgi:GNAT superfamily N-acetyltransferase
MSHSHDYRSRRRRAAREHPRSHCEIWHEGLSRSAYGQWNRAQVKTPWARTHLQRYASIDSDGRLLATAKEYRFDVRVDGREGWMCGIGAVFTPPERRGHGHASALVDELVTRAGKDGALLASLFSEIGADFYARLGFVPVPLDEVTIGVAVNRRGGAPAMLVRAGESGISRPSPRCTSRARPVRRSRSGAMPPLSTTRWRRSVCSLDSVHRD